MMLEVRANPFGPTFCLIVCRLHQGHIPARAFPVNLIRLNALNVLDRVSPSCRSVGELSIMATVFPVPAHSPAW